MKTNKTIFAGMAVAIAALVSPTFANAAEVNGWGDFKLFLDPGHSAHENQGLWGYSEAEKTLAIALNIKDMLETYTDMPAANLKLCRYNEVDIVSLEERSDMANAWGADFFYAIHSDAGATVNSTVLLFGGWRKDGVEIEKTPNGGKAYGEILDPNLSGVMRVSSRGNWYDRCFYDRTPQTHTNQYPYLSVNRRSNMPSLLSEGAYHTIAYQQSRNMNKEYKRLEAFAAFQSLLKYHGLEVPAQTFLHGEIYNSENDQRINGARITVDGKTYVTDTYESLFKKYSTNPDLIHNGLYTFEGLEAGKEYTVTIEADGFTPVTKTVTINGGGKNSADFMTFLDVAMENIMPAKVDAISITDASSVTPIYPVTITFSRNMVRETVEKALSISNDGEIEIKWINDYTLQLDLSKLLPLETYKLTIDGSIAKNTQTDQFFDGDGDGEPGGDWVYTFTMAEPDLDAPQVVTTFPEKDGEVKYATQFPIRVEFDEEINWNEDKNGECIKVVDKDGNSYTGKLTHAVITGKSVLHFFPNETLPLDRTYLVTIAPGIEDLLGNVTTEEYKFRFMTEYRKPTSFEIMLPVNDATTFWAPGGSGSSKGLVTDECSVGKWNVNPFSANGTSMEMHYIFNESSSDNLWFIREYYSSSSSINSSDVNQILTYWIYSDGSNHDANMMIRANSTGGGLKNKKDYMKLDFRGWNLFTWDIMNDEFEAFTGTENIKEATKWYFDSFTLTHRLNEDMAVSGSIGYHQFAASKWDSNAERQASLADIEMSDSAVEAVSEADITIKMANETLTVVSGSQIKSVDVYTIDGKLATTKQGTNNTVLTLSLNSLPKGVYVVKAQTTMETKVSKISK